jgi:hypothetical protein
VLVKTMKRFGAFGFGFWFEEIFFSVSSQTPGEGGNGE